MTSVSCGAGCHWQAGPRYLDIWISKYLHYLQLERRDARVGPRAVYILLTARATGRAIYAPHRSCGGCSAHCELYATRLTTSRTPGPSPAAHRLGFLQNLFRHPWSRDFSTDWTPLQYFSCDPPHFNLLLSPFIHRKLTILIWGFVGKILSMIF